MSRLLVALIVGIYTLSAEAGAARDSLLDFFNNVQTARADFTQEVYDAQQNLLQKSSGEMWLARPGRFRWDYTSPFRQLIVADGKRVWLYDVDLEQVTVRKTDNVIGNAPALLLSGNVPLEDNFDIREETVNGKQRVVLVPKQSDTGFERMTIAFDGGNLRHMELVDSLGNVTQLEFSATQRNIDIDDSQFKFVPPQGVDVIGEQPVDE